MNDRKQSSTGYPVQFFMTSAADHISGATGLTPTVVLSKNGGSFAAAAGAVTEVGNGWYSLTGSATDRNTLGELLLHATATGADPTERSIVIVPWDPFDPNLALQALPAASAGASGGLPVVDAAGGVKVSVGTGTGQVNLSVGNVTVGTNNDKAGYALSAAEHANVQADATAALGAAIPSSPTAGSIFDRVDAKVTSRLAAASYATSPTASQVATAIWTDANSADFVVANSAGAKLTSLSGGTGGPSAAQIAAAVLTDTTAGDLAVPGSIGYLIAQNLDAKVSTRSTYAGGAVAAVTAPVTVGTNNDKSGYALAAAGLDAVVVESGVNLRQAQSAILAASCGVLTGAATSTITLKAGNNPGLSRITASVDASGNRTGVTLNLPA